MKRTKSIEDVTETINSCRKFIANEPIDPIHYVIIKLLIEILDILVHMKFIR